MLDLIVYSRGTDLHGNWIYFYVFTLSKIYHFSNALKLKFLPFVLADFKKGQPALILCRHRGVVVVNCIYACILSVTPRNLMPTADYSYASGQVRW